MSDVNKNFESSAVEYLINNSEFIELNGEREIGSY